MKIIEGTPKEILEYQEQKLSTNKNPFTAKQPVKRMPFLFKDAIHWSETKKQWVRVSDMDSVHIANTVRKMLREDLAKDVLENDEFRALIVNLAYRIEEEDV